MTAVLQIGLRAGERIYINGAVVRVDRKVRLELLNDATFLLGSHVMQLSDATTPLRQVYFLVQGLLMDPSVMPQLVLPIEAAIQTVLQETEDDVVRHHLGVVGRHISNGSCFEALKTLRAALAHQEEGFATVEPVTDPVRKEVA